MLLKLRKIFIILIILAGLGYSVYFIFIIPAGFNDKETLVESYFENIRSSDVCDEHFNSESEVYCLGFTDLMDGKTLVISDLGPNGDNLTLNIVVDDVDMEFTVSFVEIEVSGVKSFMNKTYYLIDIIT